MSKMHKCQQCTNVNIAQMSTTQNVKNAQMSTMHKCQQRTNVNNAQMSKTHKCQKRTNMNNAEMSTVNTICASHSLFQGCTILHGVLTVSSDIGRFEQYRISTYPTRPNKINKKINWHGTTWIGLAKYILDLTLLEITPISSDILRYRPISP